MAKKERFCFVKDEDSNWYVIPHSQKADFNKLCEEAYKNDDYDIFEETFSKYRTGGSIHNFSFENPLED